MVVMAAVAALALHKFDYSKVLAQLEATPVLRGRNPALRASSAAAATALTQIDTAINTVTTALAALGSSSKRIEVQTEFTTQLVDILKEGVGNLVDADLAEESAKLQSLQIKQQLGVQALSIANSGPQSILALFGG